MTRNKNNSNSYYYGYFVAQKLGHITFVYKRLYGGNEFQFGPQEN